MHMISFYQNPGAAAAWERITRQNRPTPTGAALASANERDETWSIDRATGVALRHLGPPRWGLARAGVSSTQAVALGWHRAATLWRKREFAAGARLARRENSHCCMGSPRRTG